MDDNESFSDPLDGLTESDQRLIEEQIIEDAFNNSYLIITERLTFDELLDSYNGESGAALMAHDPDEGPEKDVLVNMILHYGSEEYEEYERCAELLKKLHSLYPETVGTPIL